MFENTPTLAITGFITIAIGLVILLLGYFQAKSKKYKNHKYLMIGAVITLFSFLVQYIIRSAILREETEFEGNTTIRNFIFLPILIVHISFAILTLVKIIQHLKLTIAYHQTTNTGVPFFEKEYRPKHRKSGKQTFLYWLISYVGGIIIFIMLYVINY